MGDAGGVLLGEGGLGEGEQVDGVQEVGFALTVESDEAIDVLREAQVCLPDILVVQYFD